ncbi:hypothetical protein, partial [Bradyrhizobium diazoefficiens]|uniref:hypothetical protein n=1 Tax=Bradyrhizobium diazoefficiens TaxID=1355477 RepID=UPI001B8BD700
IRSKNPRRCQAENPLKLLSEFAGPALIDVDVPFDTSGLNEPTTGVHSFGGGHSKFCNSS